MSAEHATVPVRPRKIGVRLKTQSLRDWDTLNPSLPDLIEAKQILGGQKCWGCSL